MDGDIALFCIIMVEWWTIIIHYRTNEVFCCPTLLVACVAGVKRGPGETNCGWKEGDWEKGRTFFFLQLLPLRLSLHAGTRPPAYW